MSNSTPQFGIMDYGEEGVGIDCDVVACERLIFTKSREARVGGQKYESWSCEPGRYLYCEDECLGVAEIPTVDRTTPTWRKGVHLPRVGKCRDRDMRGVQVSAGNYIYPFGASRNMKKVLFTFTVQLHSLHSREDTPKSKIFTRLPWSIANRTQSRNQTSQVNSNEAPEMLVASISFAIMLPTQPAQSS